MAVVTPVVPPAEPLPLPCIDPLKRRWETTVARVPSHTVPVCIHATACLFSSREALLPSKNADRCSLPACYLFACQVKATEQLPHELRTNPFFTSSAPLRPVTSPASRQADLGNRIAHRYPPAARASRCVAALTHLPAQCRRIIANISFTSFYRCMEGIHG